MRKKSSQSISTVAGALDMLLEDLGLKKKLRQYDILVLWQEIVGEQIAKVTSVRKIEKGTLIVHVESSVWRNELRFRKKEIIEKINAYLGETIVHEIKFM